MFPGRYVGVIGKLSESNINGYINNITFCAESSRQICPGVFLPFKTLSPGLEKKTVPTYFWQILVHSSILGNYE